MHGASFCNQTTTTIRLELEGDWFGFAFNGFFHQELRISDAHKFPPRVAAWISKKVEGPKAEV